MIGSAYLAALPANPPWWAGEKADDLEKWRFRCLVGAGRRLRVELGSMRSWTTLCYRVKMSWIKSLWPGLASYQWGIRSVSSDSGSLPLSWVRLKCAARVPLRRSETGFGSIEARSPLC
jgi:hypothetical protein